MKALLTVFAMGIAIAFTGGALADISKATTEADCIRAGGAWNAKGNECAEKSAKLGKAAGTHAGTYLGGPPETDTHKFN
jgi:hypothetical protein